jgi:NAD(P)-dependent dehydrogenase (short-subunit alcohol dehydrogenase family)
MEWDGRVVLITGGSRGIGLATAERFLAAGASVMVTGRHEEALSAALTRLDDSERARGARADVGSVAGCEAAVGAAADAFGRLDVLFTNAGGYDSAPLGEMTEEGTGDAVTALTETGPISRLVEPDEIARAVYFLAGMSAMTGTVLSVDGGTSIALP